jgi:O-antigen/teichoic acid export membrane protein
MPSPTNPKCSDGATPRGRVRLWLIANRSSARLAFVLRLVAMGVGSVMGFIWTPLLIRAMGDAVFGTFMSFQGALRLAGLGDFGLSGAVGVRTGQMIGRGDTDHLQPFLASARMILMLMAVALGLAICFLAPWLPHWLDFQDTSGAGSLPMLFIIGGVTMTVGMLCGYFNGLNLANATVTWPIVPVLVMTQLTMLGQWLLARAGAPLWMQSVPAMLGLAAQGLMFWWMLKITHPWLGRIFPLRVDPQVWRNLMATSGWVYLYALGHAVFSATDRLLINSGFGPEAVPPYLFNFKLCELALSVVVSASFVGQAKINMWIANPAPESQERSRQAVQRLLLFQSLLGTCFALGYLAVNNWFVKVWVGEAYQMPSMLQWAFALTLAITAGGDAGIQIAGLCGPRGLRIAGAAIGGAALVNLGLSFVAMKFGSINGIAYATVVAQSGLSLYLARFTARHLGLSFRTFAIQAWLLPVVGVALLAALHAQIGSADWRTIGILLVGAALLIVIQCRLAGVNRSVFAQEWSLIQGMLGRGK